MLALTLTAIEAYADLNLPEVSYIKANDIWGIVCLLFVAAALVECVVMDFYTHKRRHLPKDPRIQLNNEFETETVEEASNRGGTDHVKNIQTQTSFKRKSLRRQDLRVCAYQQPLDAVPCDEVSLRVKQVCSIVYPILFAIFNIIFWVQYYDTDKNESHKK